MLGVPTVFKIVRYSDAQDGLAKVLSVLDLLPKLEHSVWKASRFRPGRGAAFFTLLRRAGTPVELSALPP
jgi:hypothetical protein